MATIISDPSLVVLQDTIRRIRVTFNDANDQPVDPVKIVLKVMDTSGTVASTHEYPVVAPATTRIIKTAVGSYYIDIGNLDPNTETNTPMDLLLGWDGEMSDGEHTYTLQKLKIISYRTASFMPELRQLIDKSKKLVDESNDCFLGYTDGQILMYLEGGLQTINAYQPSTILSLDSFPSEFKQILIDAALITGVTSQQLYAIDTDIPNYNDQGTAFVIAHQPQLASFLNQITQRLDKLIPMMKLQLINSGSVHVQMGPNFRLGQLVQASPSGSLFRNVFFKG